MTTTDRDDRAGSAPTPGRSVLRGLTVGLLALRRTSRRDHEGWGRRDEERRSAGARRAGWVRFLAGACVLLVALLTISAFDATGRWGVAILAAAVLVALAVERLAYRTPLRHALRELGLGRPEAATLAAAAVVGALVLAGRRTPCDPAGGGCS